TALVGVGYFFVWTAFGMAAFPLGVVLAAVVVAEPVPRSCRQRHRSPPFFFPAPWCLNQHSSISVRKPQCHLRFPIPNAPGMAPSAAWRRKVLGGMPSALAASVKPIDRRLSRGERIICPPSFRTLVPCIRGPFRQ